MVKTVDIRLPMTREDANGLRAGDIVRISGSIMTARDRVHKYLVEKRPSADEMPFDLSGGVLYHCGPIIKKTQDGYLVVAAGPTTSMRVEMYEPEVIRLYGIRGIMGKGGMGEMTREALRECGCVYLHAVGGAAVYLADRIKGVQGVWMLDEFGPAEAMWGLEVADFPAIVTMDAHGNDMHKDLESVTAENLRRLISPPNK